METALQSGQMTVMYRKRNRVKVMPADSFVTAMCLEGRMPFDRPFQVPQGGCGAVAVNLVNGGRDQIVINETAEGRPASWIRSIA
jgi:hypothetical protein